MRRLSTEGEAIFKLLPSGKFRSRDIKLISRIKYPGIKEGSSYNSTKIAYILQELETKGFVKRAGKCGDCERYILWEKAKK